MVLIDLVKKFKKTNKGDVMGVVRTMFPNVEIETVLTTKKGKKS